MAERQKIEDLAVKYQRPKRGIRLFSEKKEDYESDTKDKMDPNQANCDYPL